MFCWLWWPSYPLVIDYSSNTIQMHAAASEMNWTANRFIQILQNTEAPSKSSYYTYFCTILHYFISHVSSVFTRAVDSQVYPCRVQEQDYQVRVKTESKEVRVQVKTKSKRDSHNRERKKESSSKTHT